MAGQIFTTYSFLDVQASITVANYGSFDIGSAGESDEGIRIRNAGPKNRRTIGADGDGMHTLIASDAADGEISLMKSASGNKMLGDLYNWAKSSSANWGNIALLISNPNTGDQENLVGGAFGKLADNAYATEAGLIVWPIEFIFRKNQFGNGLQGTAAIFPVSTI